MSLEDLKIQIQRRKDMKELKGKLGILASLDKKFSDMIKELRGLKESQSNEVVVKNLPDPVKEVTVSNFPKQKDSVRIDGDISLKEPKWFSFKGIEKSLKTAAEKIEKAVFKVDLDKYKKGTEALAVKLVDKDGKPYVAKGGGAYPTFGSVNLKDTSGADIDPATKTGQEDIVAAIEGITIPAPAGGSTEAKQDSQITIETQLYSLIETIQELTQRLAPLASAVANTAQLRIIGSVAVTSAPSTAVTGPITSAQSIAEKSVAGISYPEKVAMTNLMAHQSNISNVTA